jgi:hypothetical protein
MNMKVLTLKVNEIKANPQNPRIIKDHRFKQLVKSIEDFPEMLSIRDIVIDEDNMILGGNMRWKACIEAGVKRVQVMQVTGLTPAQKKEFIIKDNANYGVWDWDQLANNYDNDKLTEWGLNVWQPTQFLEDDHEESGTSTAAHDPEAEQEAEDEKADKRIIQIEFDIDDYDEANAIYKKLRGEGRDIPAIFINALKEALCV